MASVGYKYISIATVLPQITASNYGVYFFPAIFNQVTTRDRHLLSEDTRAVYNL